MTQLRSLGDNKNIVLYTNDTRVYRNLQDSDELIKLVRYEQEQGGKITTVGVDLYFPKEHRKWLEKNIVLKQSALIGNSCVKLPQSLK